MYIPTTRAVFPWSHRSLQIETSGCCGGMLFAGSRGRLGSGGFDREMLPQPTVNAFLLARVHNSLPADIASPFIVLSHHVLSGGQDGNRTFCPEPPAKVRVVDNTAVFHIS